MDGFNDNDLSEMMALQTAALEMAWKNPAVNRQRRLAVATAAMQGLLPTYPRSSEHVSVALHAVQAADALLAELDREVVS